MKSLTLHQPWASLIARGLKTSETRSWYPPHSVIGTTFAIHAAKKVWTPKQVPNLYAALAETYDTPPPPMPKGAVVATATLTHAACVLGEWWSDRKALVGYWTEDRPDKASLWVEELVDIDEFGDYREGRYVYYLDDVKELDDPWPMRGFQRFWNVPRVDEDQINMRANPC